MGRIQYHASAIANDPRARGYGFPVALLIPVAEYLLPIFLRCVASKLDGNATAEQKASEAKRVAVSAYDPDSNTYDIHRLREMRPESHRALINQGHVADRQSVDNLSSMILDRARGVGVEEIQQAVLEVCPVVGEITLDQSA